MFKYLAIISITLILLASCTAKTTENKPVNTPQTTEEPKEQPQAPERENTGEVPYENVMFTTLDGKEVKIGDYKGKRILLNLWATWCGPCVKEMPSLNRAYGELKDDNYVFLLASNEKIKQITGFSQRTNYDFQFVKADDKFRPFNIEVIPTTFVFDTAGNLAMTLTGSMEWDEENVLTQLRAVN